MAYTISLTCTNCSYDFPQSAEIGDGIEVATWLATGTNADCSNCGCNTLVKA